MVSPNLALGPVSTPRAPILIVVSVTPVSALAGTAYIQAAASTAAAVPAANGERFIPISPPGGSPGESRPGNGILPLFEEAATDSRRAANGP